jgi:glucose dehydrogenase
MLLCFKLKFGDDKYEAEVKLVLYVPSISCLNTAIGNDKWPNTTIYNTLWDYKTGPHKPNRVELKEYREEMKMI